MLHREIALIDKAARIAGRLHREASTVPVVLHDHCDLIIEQPEVACQHTQCFGYLSTVGDADVLPGHDISLVAQEFEPKVIRQRAIQHVNPAPASAGLHTVGHHAKPRIRVRTAWRHRVPVVEGAQHLRFAWRGVGAQRFQTEH